ncbi:hypothetical protein Ocin01_11222 [Orchesella cincta]|uniref:Uncharacterized protein n=1 Tax=Orchesella cincta TaxID=48709 RepID=A0A1D2MQR6_ORCCI|nr:hypothetical protein Ocin01_11222 [Orchesella cincta]
MQVDEEKIVNPIATDEICGEPMVKVKEESNCNAEKEEFGDPLFEEKNRDLNVAAVMPPIQEDVARYATNPEDVAAVHATNPGAMSPAA